MTRSLALRWFAHVFVATLLIALGQRVLWPGGVTYDAATARGVRGAHDREHSELFSKDFVAREHAREIKELRERLNAPR